MRILFVSKRPLYPFRIGGAARSLHRLVLHLSTIDGVDVRVLCGLDGINAMDIPDPRHYEALGIAAIQRDHSGFKVSVGYALTVAKHFDAAFRQQLAHFKPDVVVAQLEEADILIQTATAHGCASVLKILDAQTSSEVIVSVVRAGAEIVANSPFVHQHVLQQCGVNSHVIHSIVDELWQPMGDPNGFITLTNASPEKGVNTFLDVAGLMPQLPFLMVECWPLAVGDVLRLQQRAQQLGNVTFLRRTGDMAEVYARTRLVLVPSVWQESSARVVHEAQACHLPVIASDRGGIADYMGDGGVLVDDYLNPRAWVQTIVAVLEDAQRMEQLVAAGIENLKRPEFDAHTLTGRFFDVCRLLAARGSLGQPHIKQ